MQYKKSIKKPSSYLFLTLLALISLLAACGGRTSTKTPNPTGPVVNKCGTKVCSATEKCESGFCVAKGCDDPGGPTCSSTETCSNNQCVPAVSCKDTSECETSKGVGFVCVSGNCVERVSCSATEPCAPTKQCKYNTCVSPTVCRIPSDCSKPEETCIGGQCGVLNPDKCNVGGKTIKCGPLEQCSGGVCIPSCAPADRCLGKCTSDPTQECTSTGWVSACTDSRPHCETSTGPQCCGSGEECVNSQCIKVESKCDFSKEEYCKIGQYCEQSVKRCITFTDNPAICGYTPPTSQLEPTLKIAWRDEAVIATPIVINLTDDNHDGKVDDKDIPEIAFVTEEKNLVVIHGTPAPGTTNAQQMWTTKGTGVSVSSHYSPAAADLDGDGVPEIVAVTVNPSLNTLKGIVAYKANGTKLFEKDYHDNIAVRNTFAGAVSIADLNQDGIPEIIALGKVFDNNGEVLYTFKDYRPAQSDIPVVADMNGDDCLDVVIGRRTYKCGKLTAPAFVLAPVTMNDSTTQIAPIPTIGAVSAAVANFLGDSATEPQIVSVEADQNSTSKGHIYITDWRGNILAETEGPDGTTRGGAPTIADFDGDGRPDIGIAFDTSYAVYTVTADPSTHKLSITLKWKQTTHDPTSAITGSSVFDFQGDGKAEVVYNDENNLWVFSGDNKVLFSTPNSTATAIENPVIADVDNDGHADIVVATNPWGGSSEKGIRVFQDRNNKWVSTRPIWNQAVYNVVNINRDGTIPRHEKPNWKQPWLNNFRQNVQDGNPKLAPDLTIQPQPIFDGKGCQSSSDLNINFKLKNVGSSSVRAGLIHYKVVAKFDDHSELVLLQGTNTKQLGTSSTDNYETISKVYKKGTEFTGKNTFNLEFIVNDTQTVDECKDDNNKVVLKNIGSGAPDAIVAINSIDTSNCLSSGMIIHLQVQNNGTLPLPQGLKVDLYAQDKKIATLTTTASIAAGQSEELSYTLPVSGNLEYQNHTIDFRAEVDPDNAVEECNEQNNTNSTDPSQPYICYVLG